MLVVVLEPQKQIRKVRQMITSQPTLQSNNALYLAWRFKDQMKVYFLKRKLIGYSIRLLLVIIIGIVCWHFRPVPSFEDKTPVVHTQQGDR